MSDPVIGGQPWDRRYEVLRAQATGDAPFALAPLGLALLMQRGMAAWMAAESSAVAPDNPCAGPVSQDLAQARPGRHDLVRSELVRLLAGTALLAARGRAS